jgi:glycosyltransferase involved in cell wall biosynthesis
LEKGKRVLKVELYGSIDHPAYLDLIKYPPEGCTYIVRKSSDKLSWFKKHFDAVPFRKLYFKYREIFVHKPSKPDIDLIHACDTIVPTKMNWVADFEHVGALLGYPERSMKGWGSPSHRKVVEKTLSSHSCKKLITWSMAAKKSVLNLLDTLSFEHKLEVVYPAIHSERFEKKKSKKVNLLFIGRTFLSKGGRETLEAFEQLSKKYDAGLTMVSEVPEKYRAKYARLSNLRLAPNVPAKELKELYQEADIFVMPTMRDTFGFVFLEAMNFGLPVVALNIPSAVQEIVENGKTGFLVEPELSMFDSNYLQKYTLMAELDRLIEKRKQPKVVKGLVEKLSVLIENGHLRKKMGTEGKKRVETGKFSIKERNKKLKEIYEGATK